MPNKILPMEEPKDKSKLAKVVGGSAAALLIATVALWEGKSNDPYKDIVGVWTVCYGETNVQMKKYTDDQCRTMLSDSLVNYAQPVLARSPELQGHDSQLAAAVSLTYNIGAANYRKSTVARKFDEGQWKQACDAFMLWDRAGGKVVPGLHKRRAYERQICMKGL